MPMPQPKTNGQRMCHSSDMMASGGASQPDVSPGTVVSLQHLAAVGSSQTGLRPMSVWFLRYRSAAAGGVVLAAKLFLPAGAAPPAGWPVSVWSHGLGDPASDYRRWPCAEGRWQQTRGVLAGRWAHHGIATLVPWLPGAGPSEPLGTYSPLSLERNAQALTDGFLALQNVERQLAGSIAAGGQPAGATRLDHSCQLLRTDCVSTPLLVYFASQWQRCRAAACQGLRALVADDFQPSVAYNVHFLEPYLRRQSPLGAAALYLVWARLVWALAVERSWPLEQLFAPRAIQLCAEHVQTPVGPLPRIMASRLVPPLASELGHMLANRVSRELGRAPAGQEIRDWVFSPELCRWMSLDGLDQLVQSPVYQRYFAASDPFFAESTQPFAPGIPLLVVRRGGGSAVHQVGMPSFDERFEHMTLPKIKTLRSWGWDVRLFDRGPHQGTSFGGGPAQRWALEEVGKLVGSVPVGH